jgi:hypothetical protein
MRSHGWNGSPQTGDPEAKVRCRCGFKVGALKGGAQVRNLAEESWRDIVCPKCESTIRVPTRLVGLTQSAVTDE